MDEPHRKVIRLFGPIKEVLWRLESSIYNRRSRTKSQGTQHLPKRLELGKRAVHHRGPKGRVRKLIEETDMSHLVDHSENCSICSEYYPQKCLTQIANGSISSFSHLYLLWFSTSDCSMTWCYSHLRKVHIYRMKHTITPHFTMGNDWEPNQKLIVAWVFLSKIQCLPEWSWDEGCGSIF